MSELSDIRDQILGSTLAGQREAARASHESTVTRRILTKLRPDISIPQLLKANGWRDLSLAVLQVALPDFPIRLVAEHTPYLMDTTIPDIFKRFTKTKIFRAYEDHLDRNGWDDASGFYGLAVVWPDISAMVLHNWPRAEERIDRCIGYGRFTFTHSRSSTPRVYSLEPLDSLLDIIRDSGLCQP